MQILSSILNNISKTSQSNEKSVVIVNDVNNIRETK